LKILKREVIAPINLIAGDTIRITYKEGFKEKVVLEKTLDRAYVAREAIVFEIEAGDVEGWTDGIGGAIGS
jgi:hypothetical protein